MSRSASACWNEFQYSQWDIQKTASSSYIKKNFQVKQITICLPLYFCIKQTAHILESINRLYVVLQLIMFKKNAFETLLCDQSYSATESNYIATVTQRHTSPSLRRHLQPITICWPRLPLHTFVLLFLIRRRPLGTNSPVQSGQEYINIVQKLHRCSPNRLKMASVKQVQSVTDNTSQPFCICWLSQC